MQKFEISFCAVPTKPQRFRRAFLRFRKAKVNCSCVDSGWRAGLQTAQLESHVRERYGQISVGFVAGSAAAMARFAGYHCRAQKRTCRNDDSRCRNFAARACYDASDRRLATGLLQMHRDHLILTKLKTWLVL